MKITLLISFTIFTLSTAMARDIALTESQCHNIDIRDVSSQLQNIFAVPRNQGALGWCYAFAAADLISAEVNEKVSATHVAMIFNQASEKNIFLKLNNSILNFFSINRTNKDASEGGWEKIAINYTQKNKVLCLEDQLPEGEHKLSSKAFVMSVKRIQESYEKKKISFTRAKHDISHAVSSFVGHNDFDENEIARILLSKQINKTLGTFGNTLCGKKAISIPKLKVETMTIPQLGKLNVKQKERQLRLYEDRVSSLIKTIDRKLNEGRPFGISYRTKKISINDGYHASTVIARRWKNNRCEFKVRNSWGKSCLSYNKNVTCIKDEGAFWVSDKLLFDIAFKITYID